MLHLILQLFNKQLDFHLSLGGLYKKSHCTQKVSVQKYIFNIHFLNLCFICVNDVTILAQVGKKP